MLQFEIDAGCAALQRPHSGKVLLYSKLYIHYECMGGKSQPRLETACTHLFVYYTITRVSKLKDPFLCDSVCVSEGKLGMFVFSPIGIY